MIEILDTDEFKNEINFLSCNLNYMKEFGQSKNQNIICCYYQDFNDEDLSYAIGKIIGKYEQFNAFKCAIDAGKNSTMAPIILLGSNRVIGFINFMDHLEYKLGITFEKILEDLK